MNEGVPVDGMKYAPSMELALQSWTQSFSTPSGMSSIVCPGSNLM